MILELFKIMHPAAQFIFWVSTAAVFICFITAVLHIFKYHTASDLEHDILLTDSEKLQNLHWGIENCLAYLFSNLSRSPNKDYAELPNKNLETFKALLEREGVILKKDWFK